MKAIQTILLVLVSLLAASSASAQFADEPAAPPEPPQALATPQAQAAPSAQVAPVPPPPTAPASVWAAPEPLPPTVPRRHLITINPLSMLFGILSMEYEHAFGDRVSLAIGPDLLLINTNVNAYGLSAALRLFITGQAPEGLWIGPNMAIAYATSGGATGVGYDIGAQFGYTWIWGGFALSVGGGVRYQDVEVTDGSGYVVAGDKRVLPSLRLALGYAF
jgi:hypothetical protein